MSNDQTYFKFTVINGVIEIVTYRKTILDLSIMYSVCCNYRVTDWGDCDIRVLKFYDH